METNNVPMKYTCRAKFLVTHLAAVNESRCHSTIDSEVEVKFESYLVASTVGLSVYAGEEIAIVCKGITYYYNRMCKFQEGKSYTSVTRVPINGLAELDIECEWGYTSWKFYHKCVNIQPAFQFASQLQLSLQPFNFSNDGTTLEFNCTSFPPRLMRWTIITANGDILDFSSYDIIKVSINTTITQRPGETILNIEEASPGGNDILAVRCSTYDTLAQVVVTSHRVITEDNDVKTSEIQSIRMVTGSPTIVTSQRIVMPKVKNFS
ncbi:hypothetical protein BSL78_05896 [Apostichopus japonicus]|uniref:Uncharacterized protein n=1 Tax=Stichopus japonicus TaxID=307972 RepID=A0A2G8LAA3_STIJA|nr:hypothetical protein BSL78_05896 [Apostichopus japonicus]